MLTILEAIEEGDLKAVQQILTQNPEAIQEADARGIWCVFLAIKQGRWEILRYMVEYSRASFDKVDKYGNTALHFATLSGNLTMVSYLTERVGISPLRCNQKSISSLDLAQERGAKPVIDYFEKYCQGTLQDMYHNPIVSGFYPDPSVVRVEEDYYMVHSSFIYFPCIPILHSKDLIHWRTIGHAITDPKYAALDGLEGGRGYWAPDISYYQGRFYITATYRLNDGGEVYRKQMITSSVQPQGPYNQPVFIEEDGIDPSIFNDEDGRRYMILNRGARIFELNADATAKISEPKLLWYGDQKRAPEAPHIVKKKEYYYLFVAEGGTGSGHRISVARSKSLMGIYENCPYNPIMRQWDSQATVQCCGHGKAVETQYGEWFMVYLASRPVDGKYSILGRETYLDPITWTEDGWPLVNHLRGPSMLQLKPKLPAAPWPQEKDSFLSSNLSLEWVCPRASYEKKFTLTEGNLCLNGDGNDLHSIDCRSILLRRQKNLKCCLYCTLEVKNIEEAEDYGVTCYYDENSYIKFGILKDNDILHIGVLEYVSGQAVTWKKIPCPETKRLQLQIDIDDLKREFYFVKEKNQKIKIATIEDTSYLSSEGGTIGKRFSGAMLGVYVYGFFTGVFSDFSIEKNDIKNSGIY